MAIAVTLIAGLAVGRATAASSTVPAAIIATGENFPDAVAGGAVGGALGGPVLLVQQNAIPSSTAAELNRLVPQKIYVLGGPAVISDNVLDQLGAYTSGDVIRLSGNNRYETSAAISEAIFPIASALGGSSGSQGPAGPAGDQGQQGAKGATGPAGSAGDQGQQGAKGATGPAGVQGPTGSKGDTGSIGAQGAVGPQGVKGDTGATGPQGPKGDSGGPQIAEYASGKIVGSPFEGPGDGDIIERKAVPAGVVVTDMSLPSSSYCASWLYVNGALYASQSGFSLSTGILSDGTNLEVETRSAYNLDCSTKWAASWSGYVPKA